MARDTSIQGQVDPVQFTIVLVNEGGAWQTSSHRAVGGGFLAGIRSWLHVRVNNVTVMMLGNTTENSNGVDTAGRCGIVHLSPGAVAHVFGRGGGFYSDNQIQTIFIGFLLYE